MRGPTIDPGTTPNTELYVLLAALRRHGGTLVRAADCDSIEIEQAKREGRATWDNDGCGWVWRPPGLG